MDYKYLFDSTDRLCGAHVFVISGYLFFLRQDDGFTWAQYKAKMLRKCKILLLPFSFGTSWERYPIQVALLMPR